MATYKNSDRKIIGREGEEFVDHWLSSNGWNVCLKNYFFRGGELDRLYLKLPGDFTNLSPQYCIAEIKSVRMHSIKQFKQLGHEIFIARFLKKKQLTNMRRYGEKLEARLAARHAKSKIFLRLFIVVFLEFDLEKGVLETLTKQGRFCYVSREKIILSFEPQFVPAGQVTSKLQIPLHH